MNILDELTESYTYNGVFSFKALEDDIATLENQIDAYNVTLREIRLRNKNDKPILEKIRDNKMRLSLLKAVLKREQKREKNSEAGILNMLSVSAKMAKENETVPTAADGKQPLVQNFEAAENEVVKDNEDIQAGVMTDNNEKKRKDEEIIGREEDTEELLSVIAQDEEREESIIDEGEVKFNTDSFTISSDYYTPQKEKNSETSTEAVIIDQAKENELVSAIIQEDADLADDLGVLSREREQIEQEISTTELKDNMSQEKYPEKVEVEGIPEKEVLESPVIAEKFKIGEDTYDMRGPSNDELADLRKSLTDMDAVYVKPNIVQEHLNSGFNPVIGEEDKIEIKTDPVIKVMEEVNVKDREPVEYEQLKENDRLDCPPLTMDDYTETEIVKNDFDDFVEPTVVEDSNDGFIDGPELETYDAFPKEEPGVTVSLDLSEYTNMVNTMFLQAIPDYKNHELIVTFNAWDYEIFMSLLKEDAEKCRWFRRFQKKPRSIFMIVTVSCNGVVRKYKCEYTNCWIKYVVNSSLFTPGTVAFKYKKLKIKEFK